MNSRWNEMSFQKHFCAKEHSPQIWIINRTVANVYFNNERKHLKGTERKDEVRTFKERQLKKRKLEHDF